MTSAAIGLTPRWSLTGSLLFDLDRYLTFRDTFAAAYTAYAATIAANPLAQISAPVYRRPSDYTPLSTSLGLQYMDECTTFGISYTASPREIAISNGEKERVQTLLVRLELRTLGEANVKQSVGPVTSAGEGVAASSR